LGKCERKRMMGNHKGGGGEGRRREKRRGPDVEGSVY